LSFIDIYLKEFDRLNRLYEHDPSEFSSYVKRADIISSQNFGDRVKLVNSLLSYNRELGCGIRTEENLDKLLNHETLAVVTGQQAGLFTGPLYTIYKACTAVALASSMQEKLKRKVVPIFWVATEDHDFEEINHVYALTGKGKPEKISISTCPLGKPSVGDIDLPANWEKLINELSYYSLETEHKTRILGMLKETGRSSKNLGEWFAKVMTMLFKDYGLVFIDPMLPGVREQLTKGVQRAIQAVDSINRSVSENGKNLRELGLSPQIVKDEDNSNLFMYINGQREVLHKTQDGFFLPNFPGQTWSSSEIEELASEQPTKFSPNVVLRPIFQDLILPTLAYVAGPGEIAYYAQLRDVYPIFGLKMPIIYPRKRITLVEPQIKELMSTHGVSLGQVQAGVEDLLRDHLQSALPVDIDGEINIFLSNLENNYNELIIKLTNINLELEKIGNQNLNHLRYQLEYLSKKAWQKHRKNNKKVIEDFRRLENYFSPQGKPQERVYNFMTFLINRGPGLLEEIMNEISYEDFSHQVLTLGE